MENDREFPSDDGSRTVLGTGLLVAGAVLTVLVVIDQTGGLPLEMPRFWFVNRWLWPGLAFGLAVLGTWLLWSGSRPAKWTPSQPGRRFDSLVFYTRRNCPLCDDAKQILQEYAEYLPPIEEVDVDGAPEQSKEFGDCVPVVVIDGKVRFRGRVEETLLRRLIEGTPPKQAVESAPQTR